MAKRKLKNISKKNKKIKINKPKLENREININPIDFIKKYPGFTVAFIIAIIVILLFVFSTGFGDPNLQEKVYYAEQLHLDNESIIDESLTAIETEIDGIYNDVLEDDYLISMKSDFEWLRTEENIIFKSKPTNDVFVKEIAIMVFRNRMIEVNQSFVFDLLNDENYTINAALNREPEQNILTEDEINETFIDNEYDKQVFSKTLIKLITSYYNAKKEIINNSSSTERKFVEAKKLLLFSYS